ncbi:hypothetical protein METY_2162 [Methylopila sp. Yamaguchi]|nr:hypothetical protein METY_2162 [Methylopila sp. Yamaguchi]
MLYQLSYALATGMRRGADTSWGALRFQAGFAVRAEGGTAKRAGGSAALRRPVNPGPEARSGGATGSIRSKNAGTTNEQTLSRPSAASAAEAR